MLKSTNPFSVLIFFVLFVSGAHVGFGGDTQIAVRESELSNSAEWLQLHWNGAIESLPFSFLYNGKPSHEVLAGCSRSVESVSLDESRTQHIITFSDPQTQLLIRCVAVEYDDYPVVEWTLYFTNKSEADTPILSEIQPLNIHLQRGGDREFILHHNKGSRATRSDFEPYETTLGLNEEVTLRTIGGRPSNGALPYFNVAWSTPQRGVILAIGWPGQWQAQFRRDDGNGLQISAGQELTHFKLHPGEEVRTPLIALLQYEGDWLRGQNMWRRWMIRHNLPRCNGEVAEPQLVACSSHQFQEMLNANEANQIFFIDRYLDEKLPISYWWMDAGWYRNDGTWTNTGTWEVDRKRFPNGLRTITDHAHRRGLKSIVWFEPERITASSWLYDEHPEWLLTPPANPGGQLYDNAWRLLDLGSKEARQWLIDHICQLIESEGIDLYRQDFNVDPLLFWRANDVADRQGITEIRYVIGYLKFWDSLLERNPGLRIDSCASGGRRNDLETLRRAVPLIRSDELFEPNGQQCHTYGIAPWFPYHGTGTLVGSSAIGQPSTDLVDRYAFFSHIAPSVTACWDMRDKDLDYDALRELTGYFQRATPDFLGDYYPLTPYAAHDELDVWVAWQWVRPEVGTGVVQAFRRDQSSEASQRFLLCGLDPDATYSVESTDAKSPVKQSGQQLMEEGLLIELPEPRSAAMFFLQKIP